MDFLESQAMDVACNRRALRRRLDACKAVCLPEIRRRLVNAVYDFERKRLVGDGVVLQWELRCDPSAEPNYSNQQTSSGGVVVCTLDGADTIWQRHEHLFQGGAK